MVDYAEPGRVAEDYELSERLGAEIEAELAAGWNPCVELAKPRAEPRKSTYRVLERFTNVVTQEQWNEWVEVL